VIVSPDEIDFPEVTVPDITVCLSQEAFDRFAAATRRGGLVLYDARLVEPREIAGLRLVGVPFTELAEQRLGKTIAANVVATGAVQALTRVVGRRELTAAVKRRVPARFLDLNLDALRLGFAAVEEARPGRRRTAAPSP
jgi:2-oxoglutarate ferredoxin oxidoreductase subunit gamma